MIIDENSDTRIYLSFKKYSIKELVINFIRLIFYRFILDSFRDIVIFIQYFDKLIFIFKIPTFINFSVVRFYLVDIFTKKFMNQ